MQGLESLMPQEQQQQPQQAQGQQPPQQPQAQQQGAPTPGGVTGQLSQLSPQQLMAMYANPQDMTPKWAVASAYAKAIEQAGLMQMAQGQGAMAQNAQQQQELPVVQQVMSQPMPGQAPEQAAPPPVMAAHGGIMSGYASGGAVAFQDAGVVPPGLLNPDVDEEGLPRGKDEREQIIDYNNKIRAAYEQQMRAKAAAAPRSAAPSMQNIAGMMAGRRQLEQFYKPRDPNAYTPEALSYRVPGGVPPEAPEMAPPPDRTMSEARLQTGASAQPRATAFDITNPASINALRIAAQDTSLPEAERQDLQRRIAMMEGQSSAAPRGLPSAAAQSATPPTPGISPEMEAYFRNKASELRTRQSLPEDVLAGRAGIEALARENIAAQRGEAEAFGREARERRDAALARAQSDVFKDPAALFRLAGRIDTRKGQGFKSFSEGIGSLLTEREASAEAARREYATAQQTERALQANVRQANMLEEQRKQALREGEVARANQIKDQLDALMMQRETLLMDRRDKAIEQARLERDVAARIYAANKPGETLSLLRELFPGQPLTIDKFAQFRSAYAPSAIEKQDTAELKLLQGNLQKQVDNILLPKAERDAAAAQLRLVNAKLMEMAGLGGTTTGASNDPLGIRK